MSNMEKRCLLNSWNELCSSWGVNPASRGTINFFDFYEYKSSDTISLTPNMIRLRIEIDTNNTLFGIYYGVYFSLPKSDKMEADKVNIQWKDIRYYIDNYRKNRYFKSHDCANERDVDLEDASRYAYWPYWVEACERDEHLIKEDVGLIHKALINYGFEVMTTNIQI